MKSINYELLAKKLIIKHPELARELINAPKLEDTTFLPEIRKAIESDERLKGASKYEKRDAVIAVILTLYDPDHLEGYKKMRNGLRLSLSKLFSCNPVIISYLSKKVNNLLVIYTDFKDDVRYFADLILKKLD